jgi:hypothetical protein
VEAEVTATSKIVTDPDVNSSAEYPGTGAAHCCGRAYSAAGGCEEEYCQWPFADVAAGTSKAIDQNRAQEAAERSRDVSFSAE